MFLNLQRTGTPPRPLPRSSALPLPRSSALPLPRSSALPLTRSSPLTLYHTIASPPEFPPILSWLYTSGYIPHFFGSFTIQDDISKLSSVEVVSERLNASQAVKRYSSILEEVFICVLKSDELFSPPST